jgi:hypothetical protein
MSLLENRGRNKERFYGILKRMTPEIKARLDAAYGEHYRYTYADWKKRQARWDALPEDTKPPHDEMVGCMPYKAEEVLFLAWEQRHDESPLKLRGGQVLKGPEILAKLFKWSPALVRTLFAVLDELKAEPALTD